MEFQKKPTECTYKVPSLKDFIAGDIDAAKSVVPIVQDEFLELCVDDDGVVHSDIWLIRNKDRLDMYNAQDFAQLVATRFSQKQVSNPFAGLTDEQLFETIKPRQFQSPAQMKAWLDMLESSSKEISAVLEQYKQDSSVSEVVVDNSKSE